MSSQEIDLLPGQLERQTVPLFQGLDVPAYPVQSLEFLLRCRPRDLQSFHELAVHMVFQPAFQYPYGAAGLLDVPALPAFEETVDGDLIETELPGKGGIAVLTGEAHHEEPGDILGRQVVHTGTAGYPGDGSLEDGIAGIEPTAHVFQGQAEVDLNQLSDQSFINTPFAGHLLQLLAGGLEAAFQVLAVHAQLLSHGAPGPLGMA